MTFPSWITTYWPKCVWRSCGSSSRNARRSRSYWVSGRLLKSKSGAGYSITSLMIPSSSNGPSGMSGVPARQHDDVGPERPTDIVALILADPPPCLKRRLDCRTTHHQSRDSGRRADLVRVAHEPRADGAAGPAGRRRRAGRIGRISVSWPRFSRDGTPEGSQLAFAVRKCCPWEDSPSIRSTTEWHSLPPSSLPRYPIGFLCRKSTLAGRQRGFFVHLLDRPGVRSCLSAGGAPSATGEFGAPVPDHLPFGSSLTAS